MGPRTQVGDRLVIGRAGLDQLFEALRRRGYRLVGPTVRDGAIVYDTVTSPADLPAGWTDEQDGGHYRLRRRGDGALFGYNVGPQSPKHHLFPPSSLLWRGRREDGELTTAPADEPGRRFAFIGLRSCELHAIAIQDRVFLGGEYPDPGYAARREAAFIVAVNCGQAGGTCFCVSMGTGPKATAAEGFDLALTELLGGGGHRFLVETGTARGAEVISEVGHKAASGQDIAAADEVIAAVGLEIAGAGAGGVVVQTIGAGGVVGFSWLLEPHRYQFDGRAVSPVRALAMDGVCLRGKCEQDTRLGYALMQRFARIAVARLQATRLQVLDVYGYAGAG